MFFLLLPEEPTVAPPYEETLYDDYDEYGMSMKIRSIFEISLTGRCLQIYSDFSQREERRWDGWEMDREGERESTKRKGAGGER